jgi:hypothetical protein
MHLCAGIRGYFRTRVLAQTSCGNLAACALNGEGHSVDFAVHVKRERINDYDPLRHRVDRQALPARPQNERDPNLGVCHEGDEAGGSPDFIERPRDHRAQRSMAARLHDMFDFF